ncbi:protein kinase domain-containing protein [Sorangium sp. So ce1153]|uniref:serine/threonine-protein kinase n=1 Tax=Sorangium sp. So ce1153 TaxID=3133333 RepID=UPI003F61F7F6
MHLDTDRRRALKVMHPHLFQSEEMRQRFRAEARIAANVDSEYIVDVFDAGIDEATQIPFLVMELLRGEELGQRLKRLGRLPPAEMLTYLHQTALALDSVHRASIVHRDLKPENLFLAQRENGSTRVKILDFGVAKLVAEGATAAGATRSLGTPLYMAPEQFSAGSKLTGAVDIYALGMMAYTLLVGTPYWNLEANGARDVIAFAMVAIRGPQESPVQRAVADGVTLPPSFDAWFAQATAVDPAARFRAATVAVQALGEVFNLPVTISVPMPFQSSPSAPRRTPSLSEGTQVSLPESECLSAQALALTATSTGAAVSAVATKTGRGPLVAVLVSLGLAGLAALGWLALPTRSGSEQAAGAQRTSTPGTATSGVPSATNPTAPSGPTWFAPPPAVVPAPSAETPPASAETAPSSPGASELPAGRSTQPPTRATAGASPSTTAKRSAPVKPTSSPTSPSSLFGRN